MKKIAFWVIIILGTGFGYWIGDIILSNSTEIRTDDFIKCRFALPLVGLFVSMLFSKQITEKIIK